jgi:hypothetical protein
MAIRIVWIKISKKDNKEKDTKTKILSLMSYKW